MALIFIPPADLSSSANAATSTTLFDIGYFTTGRTATIAFRLGNTGSSPVSWTLSAHDPFDADVTFDFSLSSGNLGADEISDTITVDVCVPLDAYEIGHIADLIAWDGSDEYSAEIVFEPVRANMERRSQYPERAGNATDIASNVITSLGDTLYVAIFQPVALDPDISMPETFDISGDWDARTGAPKVCSRLDPMNQTYGYQMSRCVIQAQFQREEPQIRTTTLTATDTLLSYHVHASLVIPAENELTPRLWALFNPETVKEPATYKRTVFILKRQGEFYSIENIRTKDFGVDVSHFECDLIALHDRYEGAPDYWNPFALTYEFESDKPYAKFPCPPTFFTDQLPDSSGSGADWSGAEPIVLV